MKINISKKIIAMVVLPIIFICIAVGIISSNILNRNITNEIKIQLKTGAYSISQTLDACDTQEEKNENIQKLYDYIGMDITLFDGEAVRVLSTVQGAVGTKMDSEILQELNTGKEYFSTDANVNGESYFGYYIPFTENGIFSGAVFTGISQSEANKTITQSIVKIIGTIILFGIIAITIAGIFVGKIVRGISGLQTTVGTLLNNDLSVHHKKYKVVHDEIEDLSNKTVDFSTHLRQIVTEIKTASIKLKSIVSELNQNTEFTNDTCIQISQAIENVASGAISQAEDTTAASQNMADMSEELGVIKNNAEDLNSIAKSMGLAKNNVVVALSDLQTVNESVSKEIVTTTGQVNATSESVENIKKAVEMIQDIASQTHLLSLNASIEAAHAGEHGKGFAVVAEEIGKLASQSAQSSTEIEEILKQLVSNYNVIIQNVKEASVNMELQSRKLTDTKQVFAVLGDDIDSVTKKVTEITGMIDAMNKEIGHMVDTISNLSAISEENSACTEQTMASIQELTATINQVHDKAQNVDQSAEALMNEINIFNVS